MTSIKGGGSAFPGYVRDEIGEATPIKGMTMRQYYKAAALTGMLANAEVDRLFQDLERERQLELSRWDRAIVDTAALLADAMIGEDKEHE